MTALTHFALLHAVRDCRQAVLLGIAAVERDEWYEAIDRLHGARGALCDAVGMAFPAVMQNGMIVGRSGLITSLNVVVATCDAFLHLSSKESLRPKVAPLTLDDWAVVQGAEAAKGIVQLLTFALGAPLLCELVRDRNREYN